jgi:hypothetical protein
MNIEVPKIVGLHRGLVMQNCGSLESSSNNIDQISVIYGDYIFNRTT